MTSSGWREQLKALDSRGLRRRLRTLEGAQGPRVCLEGREVLLLCSNNYLGLASHPSLLEAAAAATARYGFGSGASRLISGTMELHVRLEERLAAFKGTEAALLFNSGYAANCGILQGLFGPDDVIFSDALNHASIIDGCRLSRARTVVYPHGDTAVLEALLVKEGRRRRGQFLIITDGVFSMDGDLAPLPELVRLKVAHEALLMVDDAHGTGVLGSGGRGTGEHFGCLAQIDLHMGTLGKALGGFGAYLAADRLAVELLVSRARSFIYSTSLPPAVAAAAMAALDIVDGEEGKERRHALLSNRQRFAGRLQQAGLDLAGSSTQIVPVIIGEPGPTMAAAERLLGAGIFLSGIRPPTVPPGRCRLRATVMADHRPEDLDWAAGEVLAAVAVGGE